MPRVAGASGDKSGSALRSWGPPISPRQLRFPRVCRERVGVLVGFFFFFFGRCFVEAVQVLTLFQAWFQGASHSLSLSPALYLSLSRSLIPFRLAASPPFALNTHKWRQD